MNESTLLSTEIQPEDIDRQTAATQARYNRIAPLYDLMEWFTEHSAFQEWRRELWSRLLAERILEVGVGTGKNMPYYPQGAQVTAIDLSEGMLARARHHAQELGIDVDLRHMDVLRLAFPQDTFEAAVATFVFCSVPVPVKGLQELGRAVKPGGDIWLLEHVRINRPLVGLLMDLANPLVVRMMGANINRQTVENVKRAGLNILDVQDLKGDLVKLIHARA
jgi:phosphatidylethanolamine/phosphatidyl-N-methylethanolamine N-methyltransferase